jgi:general secretion pathway protein I
MRRARGFSLVELIAAVALFALSFAILMQVAGASMKATRQSMLQTQAALWAQSKLDEVGVAEELEEGADAGRFDDTYRWQLEVRKIEAPASETGLQEVVPVDLYRVELTVEWEDGRNRRSQSYVTLRAIQPGDGVNP